MKIIATHNFKEEKCHKWEVVAIGERHPLRFKTQIWGSINLDRIIRMLSFFKQIEKWTLYKMYKTVSWELWLLLIHKLLYMHSLKLETLLVNIPVIKTCKLSHSAVLFQQMTRLHIDLLQPFKWVEFEVLNSNYNMRGMLAFRE